MRGFVRWIIGGLIALLAFAGLVIAAVWLWARPAPPDAFYTAAEPPPRAPGALIRAEPFTRGVPEDARAWRILYSTTQPDGQAVLGSAIVMAARDLDGPRPVLAWAHGTLGVTPACAPSVLQDPFPHIPALREILARGWIYVGADYPGLGTAGPHAYLIGLGEARAVLDAVRAARGIGDLAFDGRTVVWGHSQGGHAALWTGIIAPDYAADVPLSGVAAFAPASDLPALVRATQGTAIGKILSAYLATAYEAIYPDVSFDTTIRFGARLIARDLATRCLAGPKALVSAVEAQTLGGHTLFSGDPGAGAFGARLMQNIPDDHIDAPLFIGQGAADDLVLPEIQSAFVAGRCNRGQSLSYRTYEGRDHLSLVAPGAPLEEDALAWTDARLSGAALELGCVIDAR